MLSIPIGLRAVALASALALTAGCGSAGGGLGSILGSVLGGAGQPSSANAQLAGTFVSLDARNQQLVVQQSNGQQVALLYDNNTQVIYNNQRYAVTNLERGDRVEVVLQQTQNNAYYASTITVTQSVSTAGGSSGQLTSYQGTVQQVDQQGGLFSITNGGTRTVVQLAQQLSRADFSRFQNLRVGDVVRFYGVPVSDLRIELRQFY